MSCSASACDGGGCAVSTISSDSGSLRSGPRGLRSSSRGGDRSGPAGAGCCRSCRKRSLRGAVGHGPGSAGSLCRGLASPPVIQHEVTGRGREWRLRKLLHHNGGGKMITSGLQVW